MLRATHIDLVAGPDRAYRALAATLSLAVAAFAYTQRTLFPAPVFAACMALIGYSLLLSIAGGDCGLLRRYYPRAAHWWGKAERVILRSAWRGTLRLGRDGSAEIGDEQGYWLAQCWTSRYLVVLRLAGFQRIRTVLITRAVNHPDDYRRLLVWARFDPRQNHPATVLADRP